MWRGGASGAMGISALAVYRRRPVERLRVMRSRVRRTVLAACDRQNGRRAGEIEQHEGYRGRREVEPDDCRSSVGEAEVQPCNFAAHRSLS